MQLPLPTSDQALPGRDIPIQVSETHFVNGNLIKPPFENEIEFADFALGCFGVQKENFGKLKMFIRPLLVIWVDLHLMQLMKKFAQV